MTIGWHFDNTYSKLSNTFKEEVKPTTVHNPELVILNDQLAKDLILDFSKISIVFRPTLPVAPTIAKFIL